MTEFSPQRQEFEDKPSGSPFLHGIPVAPPNYQKPLMKLVKQFQHPKQTKISTKNWKKKHKYY